MKPDHVDVIAGALVAGVGLFAIVLSVSYSTGTVARMGPGYFPMLLGGLLVLLGLGIAVFDARAQREDDEEAPASIGLALRLRTLAALTAAPISFAVLIEPAGLVPSVFSAVFISTFADDTAGLKRALVLAGGVTLLSVLVFKVGLKLSIDLIG